MKIHFSILILIILVSLRYNSVIVSNKVHYGEEYKSPILPWLIVFGYISILAGLRTNINDTSVYRQSFEALSGTWEEIREILVGAGKDKGFNILGNLFKMFISDDYHIWFLFFAVVESGVFIYIFRRYAYSFAIAMFFFFASTLYYNYFSMMRQWFAVAIVFGGMEFIRKNKMVPYIILCCLAAQIHSSAYIMIPLYFIIKGKAWSTKQNLIVIAFSMALFFLNPLLNTLESVLQGTTYDYVITAMQTDTGSSVVRVFIAAVPVILAFVGRNWIEDDTMNICVNASIINFMLNTLATFTSGLYVIRLSNYISLYNVLLYPYLLERIFTIRSKKFIKTVFYILYFLFYIYQMHHQESFGYASDIIGKF